jgi:arylsulfatase
MYSTDNGNEFYGWPDGGSSFFRGEKNTQWEGGYRVPCVIRWPGVIKPGTLINDFAAHEDMIPTLLAAAGQPNVKQELLNGKSIGGKNYKVHLDGYNLLPALKDGSEWPRKEFIYWTDGGDVAALRYKDWKVTYLRQDAVGMNVWVMPFTELRAPMITNLKMDPFERAFDESTGYNHWLNERMFILTPATSFVAGWMESFKEFPPRMKPGSFSLDRVMEAATGGKK